MFRSNVPPHPLPAGWRAAQLSQIARVHGGGRLKLNKSHYIDAGSQAYSAAGPDGFVEQVEGDTPTIVLSSIGARCGKSFLTDGPWTTLANTQVITPNPEVANAAFLHAILDDENYWNRSGSAQPFIKPSDVKSAWVPLPPLDEQRRIADVLRSVDAAIAASEDAERAGDAVFRRRREELIAGARQTSPEILVASALQKNRGEKLIKLQTDQYYDSGRFPIIDQGARFICGYTDNDAALWPYELPVIVFGDHTRILKFIDFPFAIGADGTQCLNPIPGIRAHYLYYALQSLDLRAEGYARHFKLLKERTIPVPDLSEQVAVEGELAAIENAVAEARLAKQKLVSLKAATVSNLISGLARVPT
ncbi:restriction endonuclease subunit S [Brevundimonas sp.]|uniref:restriction endonuclease subunit S n=1 Tax=Brevundimonas sp. TaxID=1871086 RepID=UPI002631A9FA|nr:restriction endonuclease subunit S [Brevundimonas sp.]